MPERNGSFERCPRIRAGHGQTCRYYIPSHYTYDARKALMSLLQLSSCMSMSVLRWESVGCCSSLLSGADTGLIQKGMGGAVHNVDRCRTPVLIYAGASPFTFEGELKGTRFDFAMTLQGILSELLSFLAYLLRLLLFSRRTRSDRNCATIHAVHRSIQ